MRRPSLLVAAGAVHHMHKILACLAAADVFCDHARCGEGPGFGGNMRCDRDTRMCPVGMVVG